MAKTYEIYASQIYDNLRYRPTWLPGTSIELGAVGVIEDGLFTQITSLEMLGLEFEVEPGARKEKIEYSTKGAVSLTYKSAGETNAKFKALAAASAGALLEFSRGGAVVMQLGGVSFNRIVDQNALSKQLLRSIMRGGENAWQRKWVVVSEVVNTDTATIVISGSDKSSMELSASGTAAPANLIKASGSLGVVNETNIETKIIAASGMSPLFRALRVKRRFFGLFDDVHPASDNFATLEPGEVFGEAAPIEDRSYIDS